MTCLLQTPTTVEIQYFFACKHASLFCYEIETLMNGTFTRKLFFFNTNNTWLCWFTYLLMSKLCDNRDVYTLDNQISEGWTKNWSESCTLGSARILFLK